MKKAASALLLAAGCAVGLAGCGGSDAVDGAGGSSALPPLPEPDGQGQPGPAKGEERAGRSYDLSLVAADGESIGITVHEPATMVGGQKYPVLLTGSGFAGPRMAATSRSLRAPAGTPLADTALVAQYLAAGYGVISFDQRGFGGSSGQISLMDPDKDGRNLVQVLDWVEANLDWLLYRNGRLMLGSYGASYGGGYQMLLNNVDPRQRLRAMVPSITWNNLSYSLGPGNVPKSTYALALITAGQASNLAVLGPGYEPWTYQMLAGALLNGAYAEEHYAKLHYRSNAYFCGGVSQEGLMPVKQPPKVDALFLQGMADVIFNLNEAEANRACLARSGGDVRLFTYTIGHPLPSGTALLPFGTTALPDYYRCGPWVADALAMTFFDAKLKQDPEAIRALAEAPKTCLNLGPSGEGVVVDRMPVGGTNYEIAPMTVPELLPLPLTTKLFTAEEDTVVAGIPTATLTIANPLPLPGLPDGLPLGLSSNDAMIFVSLAISRFGVLPAQLEMINDQVRPLRGFGTHQVELNGIGIKLKRGDQLHLMVAGQSLPQFLVEFARNPLLPAVTVSGAVQVPVLGGVETVE